LTKRQANTIIGGIIALLLGQIICTAVLLRGQERTRMEAEAAQGSAMDTLEMQKLARAEANPDATRLLETERRLDEANREFQEAQEKLLATRDRLDADGAELERVQLELQAAAPVKAR
jgi:hypothetical protein